MLAGYAGDKAWDWFNSKIEDKAGMNYNVTADDVKKVVDQLAASRAAGVGK